VTAGDPVPAAAPDDRRWAVFVRFADEKTARRMTPDGGTTRRRIHAAQIATKQRAEQVAGECQTYLDEHHPGSSAWAGPF
jgi:hypothetical protein